MAWIIQLLEIAGPDGQGTGKWRLTATSDEDGGGPFGLDGPEHEHVSGVAASGCPECREYCDRIIGIHTTRPRAHPRIQPATERTDLEAVRARVADMCGDIARHLASVLSDIDRRLAAGCDERPAPGCRASRNSRESRSSPRSRG